MSMKCQESQRLPPKRTILDSATWCCMPLGWLDLVVEVGRAAFLTPTSAREPKRGPGLPKSLSDARKADQQPSLCLRAAIPVSGRKPLVGPASRSCWD